MYTSAFLQLYKETGARSGEVARVKWTDIDFEHATVRGSPQKGSNPKLCKLSTKAIQMINQIPRNRPAISLGHHKNMNNLHRSFQKQRKETAAKMGYPRLLQIHFHTLRHWKATMEYHKTRDILHVMRLLGNKSIKNILVYTQLVAFENDDFVCKAATNVKEAAELIEAGYEYVCNIESVRLFRKRK